MRVLNRVFVVLLCLVLIALLGVLIVAPALFVQAGQNALAWLGTIIGQSNPWMITVAVAVLLILALAYVVYREVAPRRRRTVRIRAQGRGNAQLRVDSVAQTIEYRIDELEGVRKVVPQLVSHGADISVNLGVDASPSVNIPALSDQVIDLAIRILEGELGLKIRGPISLEITHEPYSGVPSPAPSRMAEGAHPVTLPRPAAEDRPQPMPRQAEPAASRREPAPQAPPVQRPEPVEPEVVPTTTGAWEGPPLEPEEEGTDIPEAQPEDDDDAAKSQEARGWPPVEADAPDHDQDQDTEDDDEERAPSRW